MVKTCLIGHNENECSMDPGNLQIMCSDNTAATKTIIAKTEKGIYYNYFVCLICEHYYYLCMHQLLAPCNLIVIKELLRGLIIL